MSSKRKIAIALCCFILPIFFLAISGLKINSNIIDLIPASGHSQKTEEAISHFTKKIASNNLFLIKNKDEAAAFKAAASFENLLKNSDLFSEIHGQKSDSDFKNWFDLYFPHRFHLLSDEGRAMLSHGEKKEFLKSRIKKLYSTQSSLYSSNLEKDPLMLFGDFIQGLPSPGSFSVKNGFLYKSENGQTLLLLSAHLKDSVFSSQVQKKFRKVLDTFINENPSSELLQLGFFPYAEKARKDAEWEISFIGTGSAIGVILLFIIFFKSASQLLYTLGTICGAICFGALVTQNIFHEIHIITIVFGATLTGVCVDYAFHWFSHLRFGRSSESPEVKKGIYWGALTSIIAYLTLFLSGFPGLRQIAVFSSSGILFSALVCLFLYPDMKKTSSHINHNSRIFTSNLLKNSAFLGILSLILCMSAAGYFFTESNDDIRVLQNKPQKLLEQENEFRSYLSPYDSSRFILVNAPNSEELIAKESEIIKYLINENLVEDTLALSSMLPPMIHQQGDYLLLSQLVNSKEFEDYCKELDFTADIIPLTRKMLNESQALSLETYLKSPAAKHVKSLYLTGETPSSIILLKNIKNEQALRKSLPEEAVYIDKVNDTSQVLGKFRYKSLVLTIIAYILITLCLLFLFGPKQGFLVILPPLAAVFIACGLWSLFGGSFNLFNILALILVLGIGIDYSIFYAFSGKNKTTESAITLSTISTLLAFGLLSFSSTPALSSFGMTLALGISFSYVLAPMASLKTKNEFKKKSHSYKQ